jgi:hypothetical protein
MRPSPMVTVFMYAVEPALATVAGAANGCTGLLPARLKAQYGGASCSKATIAAQRGSASQRSRHSCTACTARAENRRF